MSAKDDLKKSVRLHREASRLANKARLACWSGDDDGYLRYTREALGKEAKSAELLRHDPSHHMYAILHRSAATLAYRCGEYEEAEDLIAHGLSGNIHDFQRDELQDLLDKVKLRLSPESRQPPGMDDELELALQSP